jgi:hypothetical protein
VPKAFVLDQQEKRTRLAELITQVIAEDCEGGRQFIARMMADPDAQKPPHDLMQVMEKNIEIREAVYREIRSQIERTDLAGEPLTLEKFYHRFVMAFTSATMNEDAYSMLFLNQVQIHELPEDMRRQIEADKALHAAQGEQMALIAVPQGTRLTPDEMRKMQMRMMTIEQVAVRAFDAFFTASTGVQEINDYAPEYRDFLAQVSRHLHGERQGRQRR